MSLTKFKLLTAQNNSVKKTLHLKIIHFCEVLKSMLFNYFGKKQQLKDTFGEIWRIQIQMYP